MEPVISEGLGQEGRNLQISKQNTMAHLTGTGCHALSGRGCGNTGLCDKLPKKKTDEGADHNLHR